MVSNTLDSGSKHRHVVTTRQRRLKRQKQARRRATRPTLGSWLFWLGSMALVFGGISSVVLHEYYINDRNYEVDPSHWNVQTKSCDASYKRIGNQCVPASNTYKENRFYESLAKLETAFKWQLLYTCDANQKSTLSDEEVKSKFREDQEEGIKKL